MDKRQIQYNAAARGGFFARFGGLAALGALAACAPMERPTDLGVDCGAEDAVFLSTPVLDINNGIKKDHYQPEVFGFAFEDTPSPLSAQEPGTEASNFFCFSDPTISGYPTTAPWPSVRGCPLPQQFDIDPFCQRTDADIERHHRALHLQSGHHDFWGGRWANWNGNTGNAAASFKVPDATGVLVDTQADGIAFWAKREMGSNNEITIAISDDNTAANDQCASVVGASAGQGNVTVTVTSTDPNVQTSNNGNPAIVQDPRACANYWSAPLDLTDEWELHLMPWSVFHQDFQPNREMGPLNPKHIYQIGFVYRTGQVVSAWFDEVLLYKKK